jgi:hypothetical protein
MRCADTRRDFRLHLWPNRNPRDVNVLLVCAGAADSRGKNPTAGRIDRRLSNLFDILKK